MTTILTDSERATLVATLNRLVPARDDLPGAGDLGVAATIEQAMEQSPARRRSFLDVLRSIDQRSGEQGFATLSGDESASRRNATITPSMSSSRSTSDARSNSNSASIP